MLPNYGTFWGFKPVIFGFSASHTEYWSKKRFFMNSARSTSRLSSSSEISSDSNPSIFLACLTVIFATKKTAHKEPVI